MRIFARLYDWWNPPCPIHPGHRIKEVDGNIMRTGVSGCSLCLAATAPDEPKLVDRKQPRRNLSDLPAWLIPHSGVDDFILYASDAAAPAAMNAWADERVRLGMNLPYDSQIVRARERAKQLAGDPTPAANELVEPPHRRIYTITTLEAAEVLCGMSEIVDLLLPGFRLVSPVYTQRYADEAKLWMAIEHPDFSAVPFGAPVPQFTAYVRRKGSAE